ncbi:MAG: hypothetical protein VYB40_06770, partial [Candidatus Thermoplasmatota archaeon]|nr:hypothetical protein [Candidatus Thermoplasmatota archaeon]
IVQGRIDYVSKEVEFELYDDGGGADEFPGDGIFTGTIKTNPGSEEIAVIKVWAMDGDTSSTVVQKQLNVNHAAGLPGIFGLMESTGVIALVAIILILILLGGFYRLSSQRRLAADLELIESWGSGLNSIGDVELGEEETAPSEPNMDAEAPPALSDFGDS